MKNTKRKVATLLALAVCTVGHTQITVTSDGNVGVGINNPLSKLSINTEGDSLHAVRIENPMTNHGSIGLYATSAVLPPACSGNLYRAIQGSVTPGYGTTFGLYGKSVNATPQYSGQAYGVCGEAGNATNGWNYGVCGFLSGSNNGAAIFGKTQGSGTGSTNLYPYRGITPVDSCKGRGLQAEIGNGLDCLTNTLYPAITYTVSCTPVPFDKYLFVT